MALLALWNPNIQFLKTDGTINAGGKLVVTDHNDAESIPANYSDADGTTLNSSPIVLDALGRATCYIDDASTYDLYVKDANGATLWTVPEMTPGAETIVVRAGFSVSSNDSSVAVVISVDPNGVTNYDLSIQDETDRATAAEKAAKTVIVAGDNITVTKTVGADGQDVYTVSGEAGDNLVEDVRVNGASVVTDKVANIDVPVAGTASPLMDGTASAGASGKYAREDHVHPSDTSREAVANKTTVVQGSSDSKYPTDKAVWNFVNSSIATNTAYYISDNGEPFTSVEELEAYPGIVTNNDYAFVTGVDSAGNTYYDRYKATVRDSTVTWALEYRLNNSSFTAAQWAAINSGITSALVGKIHEHSNKAVLDGITATDVSNWSNKMSKQTAGNASTPIYLNDGTATACGTLTGYVLSSRAYAGISQGIFKILSISTVSSNRSGVIVPWIGNSDNYPHQGELHICSTYGTLANWKDESYNLFYSNVDSASRHQFYLAEGSDTIDIYVVMPRYAIFARSPTTTVAGVTYVNTRVTELPEDAVKLTDRVNASLPAWSVGSASTPVYFENGVAKEATTVSGKAIADFVNSSVAGKKDKQTAVTFTGSTLKTLTSMTQDANGELAVTFTDIQSASTSQKGVVQLSDSTASASSETAATSAAVKQAYDIAASKQDSISWMTDAEAVQLWADAWDAAT